MPKLLLWLALLFVSINTLAAVTSVSSFSPLSGPVGSQVTITGSSFNTTATNNIVYFGTVKAVVIQASATQLTVTVPSGASYNPITVTDITSGTSAKSRLSFAVTFPTKDPLSGITFENASSLPTPVAEKYVIKDLDGDGRSDIITANVDGTLTIFNNQGNLDSLNAKVFPKQFNLTNKNPANSVQVDDIDGDGKPDIIVATGPGAISVFKNSSSPGNFSVGNFTRIDLTITTSFGVSLFLGDMDGDGRLDIIGLNDTNLVIYKNNMTATAPLSSTSFTSAALIPLDDIGINRLIVNDFDGDGRNDIIFSGYKKIYVIQTLSSTPGMMGPFTKTDLVALDNYLYITAADINSDGKLDLLVTSQSEKCLYVYQNQTSPGALSATSFSLKTKVYCGRTPTDVKAADLDGDGRPDIAVVNNGDNDITFFKNIYDAARPGPEWLSPKTICDPGIGVGQINIADLNGDGKPDITFNAGNILMLKNKPVAIPVISSFTPMMATNGSTISITGKNFGTDINDIKVYFDSREAQITAVTGTSVQVIVPAGVTSARIGIFVLSEKRSAWSPLAFKAIFNKTSDIGRPDYKMALKFDLPKDSWAPVFADLDGDGFLDMVYTRFFTSLVIVPHSGKRGHIDCTTYAATPIIYNYDTGLKLNVKIKDINNDGRPDILATPDYFNGFYYQLNTSVKGKISFAAPVKNDVSNNIFGYPYFYLASAVEDIDGDGRPDILAANGIFRNTTNENAAPFTARATSGYTSSIITLFDIDGDGKADLVTPDLTTIRNTCSPGVIADSLFIGTRSVQAKNANLFFTDLDNDGKTDFVYLDKLYKNNSTIGTLSFKSSSGFTDAKMVADLNGDGLPEMITETPGNYPGYDPDTAYIYQNRAGSGQLPVYNSRISYAFDFKSDQGINYNDEISAVEDINNDNKPDIVFFDYLENTIFIFENTMFNAEGDIPPSITNVSQTTAAINTSLKIDGNNFSQDPGRILVYLGNTKSIIQKISSTSITIIIPAGAASSRLSIIDTLTKLSAVYSLRTGITFGNSSGGDFTAASFKPPINLLKSAVGIYGVAYTDFNADGVNDLLVNSGTIYTSNSKDIYNNATGYTKTLDVPVGKHSLGVRQVADLNGDGKPEIIYIDADGYHIGMGILENTSTTCGVSFLRTRFNGDQGNLTEIYVADINGDGKPDLVTQDIGQGKIAILLNTSKRGSISFSPFNMVLVNTNINSIGTNWKMAVRDFDGDGKPDIFFGQDGSLQIFRNNTPTGAVTVAFDAPLIIPGFVIDLKVEDLTGDGKPDIAINTGKSIDLFKNTSVPGVINASSLSAKVSIADGSPNRYFQHLELHDMDGDGRPDIIWDVEYDSIVICRNQVKSNNIDNTAFQQQNVYPIAKNFQSFSILDYNADGRPDIILTAPNGVNDIDVMLNNMQNNGLQLFTWPTQLNYEATGPAIAVDSYINILNNSGINITSAQIAISTNYASGQDLLKLQASTNNGNIAAAFNATTGVLTLTSAGASASNTQWTAALKNVTFNTTSPDLSNRLITFNAIAGGSQSPLATRLINIVALAVPAIQSFTPAIAADGDVVTITGVNFQEVTVVSFGSTKAKSFTVNSDNTISAIVASGASGNISITNQYGSGILAGFTFVNAPVITASNNTIYTGSSILLTASGTLGLPVQWAKEGIDIPGAQANSLVVTNPGNYTVKLVVNNRTVSSALVLINSYFVLPPNNFALYINSATCKGTANGSITITAAQNFNYTATVTGGSGVQTFSFTNNLAINNLPRGSYNICFTVTGQPGYQQCFTAVVTEPKDLSLYSAVNTQNNSVTLSLEGSDHYLVTLNGITTTANSSNITLPLRRGKNTLTVASDKSCQGVLQKEIIIAEDLIAYPNPFTGTLYVNIGTDNTSPTDVGLYKLNGNKIFGKRYNNAGTIQLDVSALDMGIYLVKVITGGTEKTYKVIKK